MSGKPWTPEQDAALVRLAASVRAENGLPDWRSICKMLGRTGNAVRLRYGELRKPEVVEVSPYPKYESPLLMEGDALVIPDPEFPFHHADFLNRCLELADRWGIRQCNIAGDVMHFDGLSSWEANWITPSPDSGLSDKDRALIEEIVLTLQPGKRDSLLEILDNIGKTVKDGSPSVSQELEVTRKQLNVIGGMFDQVDIVIGNHDGRLLRMLNSATFADDFRRFIGATDPKWRIAPYYFSYVVSDGVPFQIEHPKNSAKYSAQALADKFQCHILMAHSHRVSMVPSRSGHWMGWQIGCCVDERRLPYASQRHNTGDAHALGAAIIRGGYATVLTEHWTDWARLMKYG